VLKLLKFKLNVAPKIESKSGSCNDPTMNGE